MAGKHRQIFLCGVHSVGKTTLLQQLSSRCSEGSQMHFQSEVARSVIREIGLQTQQLIPRKQQDQFEDLQDRILQRQCKVERGISSSKYPSGYVMDRGIDPLVYSRYYLGEEAYQRLLARPHAQECVSRYKDEESLVFVISPHPECVASDGVRLMPDMKEMREFTDVMVSTLTELGIRYVLINELDINKRVRIVQKAMV
eukprot:m.1400 g.1400  ORF g.1400 m.1400 type:complete len:199 (+) comp6392_c0_seq2:60-656(+)